MIFLSAASKPEGLKSRDDENAQAFVEGLTSGDDEYDNEKDNAGDGDKNDGKKDGSEDGRKEYRAGNCNDCNRQFCLDYNLPICKKASMDDVFTTCFRESALFVASCHRCHSLIPNPSIPWARARSISGLERSKASGWKQE